MNDDSKRSSMKVPNTLDEREIDELLALCQAAADMWKDEFDVVNEIHRMREERDRQILACGSI